MIPQDKQEAVVRGLREAFGTEEIEDIQKMTRGMSADLVFRIAIKGTPYLLRVMTRINEQTDPVRHFTSMRIAAEGGVAPKVHYTDTENGIAITDFVEASPLAATEGLVLIPRMLRRLHALPVFPKTFNYVTAHNMFIWRFRKAGLLDGHEVEEVFRWYEQVCAVYPRPDEDVVSSHSDLKPENILFDGERLWLVDWQAAFLNDRYFDLCVAGNFVIRDEADEDVYLREYFGEAPDEYQRARFYLMRQVTHMFYATVFLLLGLGGKAVDREERLPSWREFHDAIWAGKVDLADSAARVVYGRVHWGRLLQNVRGKRFGEALRIVADRDAGAARLLPSASID